MTNQPDASFETKLTPPVDSRKVVGRRMLRFESIDQALSEAERLAEAERGGHLRRVGTWMFGQAFNHLAAWAEFAYTGSPLKVPLILKWYLRLQKRKLLYGPMRVGVKIPGVEGGTLATEVTPLDEGLARFRRLMERLKTEAPTAPNAILGKLTHEETIALNMRHAELHLSFFVPE